jgi:AraC family transcriptional activator of pobA
MAIHHRRPANYQVVDKKEAVLSYYFEQRDVMLKGLPIVKYLTEKRNISTGYLSRLLKELTSKSTQSTYRKK